MPFKPFLPVDILKRLDEAFGEDSALLSLPEAWAVLMEEDAEIWQGDSSDMTNPYTVKEEKKSKKSKKAKSGKDEAEDEDENEFDPEADPDDSLLKVCGFKHLGVNGMCVFQLERTPSVLGRLVSWFIFACYSIEVKSIEDRFGFEVCQLYTHTHAHAHVHTHTQVDCEVQDRVPLMEHIINELDAAVLTAEFFRGGDLMQMMFEGVFISMLCMLCRMF